MMVTTSSGMLSVTDLSTYLYCARKLYLKKVLKLADEAVKKFGDDAYAPRELRSPAQVERLEGGRPFVAQWAYKPEVGQTVAPDTDARQGQTIRDATETFKSVLQSNK